MSGGRIWVVFKARVCLGVLFVRVPYYFGDLKGRIRANPG